MNKMRTRSIISLLTVVVMITATAFTSLAAGTTLSKDIQTFCRMMDNAAVEVGRATSEQELVNAMHRFETAETDIDEATILTEADKVALKKSYMDLIKASVLKTLELSKQNVPTSEADKVFVAFEQKVEKVLKECVTLGDFITKAKQL